MKNRRGVLPGLALACLLAACGGGGGEATPPAATDATPSAPGSPTTPTAPITPTAPATPAAMTLPAYAAKRAERATTQGFPAPSEQERRWLADGSRGRALDQLAAAWAHGESNALALPPLEAAFGESVAAAARGDTLAQLRAAYPAAPGPYAASVQTQGVERILRAPAGTRFDPGFLEATDSFGPLPALDAWSAAEVGDWAADLRLPGVFDSALGDLRRPLYLPLGPDTRLLLAHRQFVRLPLPKADEAFIGVFAGAGERLQGPMLRFTGGVTRHDGADFRASALAVGSQWIIALRPTDADLRGFSARRLSAALGETTQALIARTLVALPTGEMVLPRTTIGFAVKTADLQRTPLAAAERQADLRGLDGGGTFLSAIDARAGLRIDEAALEFEGGHLLAFNFSTLNAYAGDGLHGTTTLVTPDSAWPAECPDGIDLRPFFLAVFDGDLRLVALAAVGRLNTWGFKSC